MFKPGQIAVHVGQRRGIVTILPGAPAAGSRHKWPILTSDGVVDETKLIPGDPRVLATAGISVDADGVIKHVPLVSASQAALHARMDALDKAEKSGERLPVELRQEVQDALSKAPLVFNGHWKNGTILHDFKTLKHLFLAAYTMSKADAEALIRGAKSDTPLDRWIPIDVNLSLTGLRACSFCGEEDFATETDGKVVRIVGEPCKFPNGLPPTEWELNVPSGKLVVANDLRELFPLPEDEDFDTTLGCRQTALAYAANGMAHAFVGNSCPGVYECGKGLFKIANEPWEDAKPRPKFEGKRVAGICTDLWWYSLCDQEEFERRCKRFKQKAKNFRVETITLKPGVYRFHHNEEARRQEGPKERVYTRFEWVREPDPVKDFLANYEVAEVNAHAYVLAQVARWPTLYGKITERLGGKETATPWSRMTAEDRINSWRAVADHVFCTIGGGTEWHEKGFPKAKVDAGIPDVDPPSFRAQHHWYPFSKPYGGLFEPKTLAPSFVKLAFRVLESVISFGMDVHDSEHSREVRYVRERMLVAVQRYRELAKQYPDLADPEYVAWLGQKGRAEAWVENFPLGPEFTEKHRKNIERQRWVPEDAYAIVFDARELKDGHFAWHPKKGGCWAAKKDAQRYAIVAHEDNGQPAEHNCFWASNATNTSIPLYSVARVVKVGEVSHMGQTLVELAFDYGTPWMRDKAKRKAVSEASEKAAIKVLSRKEYEKLLPKAKEFFETAEKAVKKD
jgi:hypothetical protein